MRLASLLGPDLHDTLAEDPASFREAMDEFHPEDIAEILNEVPEADAVAALRALAPARAAEVLERLDAERQKVLLAAIEPHEMGPLVAELAPDERVDLLQAVPEELATRLLTDLERHDPEGAEEVRELRGYGEKTAGGLMTTEFVGMPPEATVAETIEHVRRMSRQGDVETIYYVYVLAFGGRLVGVVSLRELILADPTRRLEEVMTTNVVTVSPEQDQEQVAEATVKYDFTALPVVDERGILLGLITVDDVFDVVIEEATEDAQKMGGVVPLEEGYFDTGFLALFRKRVVWLIVLCVGQFFTASVLENNEAAIAGSLSLLLFIPMIISSGGNSGSQSSTLVIRALAIGEMTPKHWLRVASRELVFGLTLGLVLGAVGFARAIFSPTVDAGVAIVVGASMAGVVIVGNLLGSLMPLVIKRFGFDPAVSSTPLIASVSDVLGLLIYFGVAQALLSLAV